MFATVLRAFAGCMQQFISTCRLHLHGTLKGYGLNSLDLRLHSVMGPSTLGVKGYYVELGANNGLTQSNTYLLQRRYGWTGLLIEPSPAKYLECVRNRTFGVRPSFRCAACVDSDFAAAFVGMRYSDLMTVAVDLDLDPAAALAHADTGGAFLRSVDEHHSFGAVAQTLTSLLDEVAAPLDFDLLSLDVEGNELAVLRGLDFSRYRPRWILVEVQIGRAHV